MQAGFLAWEKREGSGVLWGALVRRGGEGGMPDVPGHPRPRLDQKGRLILPAKFRDELAGGVVLSLIHI